MTHEYIPIYRKLIHCFLDQRLRRNISFSPQLANSQTEDAISP